MQSVASVVRLSALVSLLFLTATQVGAEIAPIKIDAIASTYRDLQKKQITWAERALVAPFALRAKNKSWGAPALAFVKNALPPWALRCDCFRDATLAAEATSVLAAGGNDPLVQYLAGWAIHRGTSDWRTARGLHEAAVKALATDRGYPAALRFLAASAYADVQNEHWRRIDVMVPVILQSTRELLTDKSYRPEEVELLVYHLMCRNNDEADRANAEALLTLYRDAPIAPWARQTLLGSTEIELAWKGRGSGWADTVTPQGWKDFEGHLSEAEKELSAAWKAHTQRPEAAWRMIVVSMGRSAGPDVLRRWFDRATAAQFDFDPAYDAYHNALRPRWGGSMEDVFALGRRAAETERYDTDVPLHLFRACRSNSDDLGDARAYYRRPDVAAALLKTSRGLLDEPLRKRERPLNFATLAVHAWLAGDYALAQKTLAETPPPFSELMQTRLKRAGLLESEFRAEVAIGASAANEDFQRGARALVEGKLEEARAAFRKARSVAPADLQPHLDHQLRLTDLEEQLRTRKWVKMPLDLRLMRPWLGEWKTGLDGALSLAGAKQDGLLLLGVEAGADYECRGEFEYQMKPKAELQLQVVLGWFREYGREKWTAAETFQPVDAPPTAALAKAIYRAGQTPIPIEMPEKNQFLIRVENGAVSWQLNDRWLMEKLEPKVFKIEKGPIGFSAISVAPGTTVKLRSFEVRRVSPPSR